jgi:ring-1,2-phenylacetyl-CoA epoxidase subunit PaaE
LQATLLTRICINQVNSCQPHHIRKEILSIIPRRLYLCTLEKSTVVNRRKLCLDMIRMVKDTSFYELEVSEKVRETADTVTLYFSIPDELTEKFTHQAGQHLTLRFDVKGNEERRSYSLCTRPGHNLPGVTVKRVKGGRVSNYIHDKIVVGDKVQAMPPDGRFILTPDPEKRCTYYFIGAGSGITPLMSQLSTILEEEPMSTVHLYYGNRDSGSIIFKEKLDKLVEKYGEQLTVDHILSKPNKSGGLGSIFKRKKDPLWTGEIGRIASEKVGEFIDRYQKRNEESQFFICGPGNMIEHVKSALSDLGTPSKSIHMEYFTAADLTSRKKKKGAPAGVRAHAKVTLRGEEFSIDIADQPILDALQDAGYDPPYSCTSGACASCMAKIVKGSVDMEMCFALSDDEIKDGFILTCQSHPTSEEIEITYDV